MTSPTVSIFRYTTLTGHGSYAIDLSAMQLGVADYLEKSQLTLPLLERSIRYAIERNESEKQLEALVQERTRDLALMKKQALGLASLQKATSSLLHTLNISRLMGQILDAAQEAIPSAEHARLHIIEHQHGRGKILAELPLQDPRILRIDLSGNLEGPLKDISEGYSLLIPDLSEVPAVLALIQSDQGLAATRSAMIAPMILNREVLGALSLTAGHFLSSDSGRSNASNASVGSFHGSCLTWICSSRSMTATATRQAIRC